MKQSTYARRVLKALEAQGWTFRIEDDSFKAENRHTVPQVMSFLNSVDELNVDCFKENKASFLFFVWQSQNETYPEGEEILCDHGVSLSSIIDPLYEEVSK